MGKEVLGGVGASININWSDTTAVLLEVSGFDSREQVVCRSLLPDTDDDVGYCRFSFRRSVADQFSEISQHADELPDQGLLVQVRGGLEEVFDPTIGISDEESVSVKVVNDPSNMTKLGMTLTDVIDDVADDGKTAFCFDSLTALLQYVSLEDAIQFVTLTNSIVRDSGGGIHYHVDPNAHETETIDALHNVIDTVIRIGDTGVTKTEAGNPSF